MNNGNNKLNPYILNLFKHHKDKLANFYSLNNEEKRDLFYDFYGAIPINNKIIGGEITKIFLKLGINPLNYMNFIPDWFLYGCTDIFNINIPDNVDEINDEAFAASGLTHIDLPKKLDRLHYGVFENCANLRYIEIPDGVSLIPRNCFKNCTNLESVIFPYKLDYIETGAFKNCISLEEIIYPGRINDFLGVMVHLEIGWRQDTINLKEVKCQDGIIDIDSLKE